MEKEPDICVLVRYVLWFGGFVVLGMAWGEVGLIHDPGLHSLAKVGMFAITAGVMWWRSGVPMGGTSKEGGSCGR